VSGQAERTRLEVPNIGRGYPLHRPVHVGWLRPVGLPPRPPG